MFSVRPTGLVDPLNVDALLTNGNLMAFVSDSSRNWIVIRASDDPPVRYPVIGWSVNDSEVIQPVVLGGGMMPDLPHDWGWGLEPELRFVDADQWKEAYDEVKRQMAMIEDDDNA